MCSNGLQGKFNMGIGSIVALISAIAVVGIVSVGGLLRFELPVDHDVTNPANYLFWQNDNGNRR